MTQLPDSLTRRPTMPDQALPFVLVELLMDTDDHQFRIRSGNAIETADDRASILAGALYAVLRRGDVGPEWSGVSEAIASMPDVGDDAPARPPITVLCGSTRFGLAFEQANLRLTLAGKIVLTIGCNLRDEFHRAEVTYSGLGDVKAALDQLHLRKIDLADEVLVLDVGGYIGESTRREIAYAERLGKPISYLSQEVTRG